MKPDSVTCTSHPENLRQVTGYLRCSDSWFRIDSNWERRLPSHLWDCFVL